MTSFPVNIFPNNEAPKVPNNIPRNRPYFVSYSAVSRTQSIKIP